MIVTHIYICNQTIQLNIKQKSSSESYSGQNIFLKKNFKNFEGFKIPSVYSFQSSRKYFIKSNNLFIIPIFDFEKEICNPFRIFSKINRFLILFINEVKY